MNFILAKTFTDSLAKLDKPAQALVKGAVFDFEQNPDLPGFQFHRVTRAKDPNMWTARVNDDLRMVIHHKGDRMVFCWVDRHDPAYAWAETRKIVENEATGSAQIVEIKEVVQEVTRTVIREVVRKPALFKSHAPSYLLALGVPPEWLEAVRHVDEDGLDALKDHLPAEAFERLYSLALGEVVPVPTRPAASSDPFLHPDAQRRFAVMTDQEEIRRALEQPWEQWMVFLHPTQRAVVARRFNGPARVTGSAGTGKSVVAIHRAARLARAAPKGAVLLTTYSRTLAARLAEQLALVLPTQRGDGPVVVEHLHRGARATVSVLRGPTPEARGFADASAEVSAVAQWLKALRDEGFAPRDIAVFGRSDGVLKDLASKALETAQVPQRKLSDKEPVPTDAAAVGTMHRAKGLEFRAVAVMGCAEGVLPSPAALKELSDPEDLAAAREQERQLLYVASTRARERLLLTWSGTRSSLLQDLDMTLAKGGLQNS